MSAEIKTYAMIDSTGTVQNVCLWDGVAEYVPTDDAGVAYLLVQSDTAQVGDHYDGSNFTTAAPPP
jgi:hypothetical protein